LQFAFGDAAGVQNAGFLLQFDPFGENGLFVPGYERSDVAPRLPSHWLSSSSTQYRSCGVAWRANNGNALSAHHIERVNLLAIEMKVMPAPLAPTNIKFAPRFYVPAGRRIFALALARSKGQNRWVTARPLASIGNENAGCVPALQRQGRGAMEKRRRFKQIESLQERLSAFARNARDQADRLRPGPERDELLKKARQADTASHIDSWANSPGLQPPK
jgi:hypothetical protein